MKNILSSILIIAIIMSCSNDKQVIMELTGENIIADIPYAKIPFRINIHGEFIYLLDLVPMDSCYCHILQYPNCKYIRSIGKRGNGPGEIVLITPFQMYKDEIMLYDGVKSNLYQYTENGTLTKTTHFNINRAIDFVCINDTTLLVNDMSGQNRFLHITPSSSKGLFQIPVELCDRQTDNKHLWRSYMTYNKDSNKLAMATQFGEIIEIFDLNNQSVIRIGDKKQAPRSMSKYSGYKDIKWHDNKIYALLSVYKKTEEDIQGGDIIQVYSEYGELLNTYHLDQHVYGFSIDNEGHYLWAICPNSDNPIFKYKLP